MHRLLTVAALILGTAPAVADSLCDDLWLSRNAVFDTAGFCFRSNLGQALFDNEGCTTQSPNFDERQQANIARISSVEEANACNVDINRRSLDVADAAIRVRLIYQPVARPEGEICRGYFGPALPLRPAPFRDDDAELGALAPGDTLTLRHESTGNWSYVSVLDGDAPSSGGWIATGRVICEARESLNWDGN